MPASGDASDLSDAPSDLLDSLNKANHDLSVVDSTQKTKASRKRKKASEDNITDGQTSGATAGSGQRAKDMMGQPKPPLAVRTVGLKMFVGA